MFLSNYKISNGFDITFATFLFSLFTSPSDLTKHVWFLGKSIVLKPFLITNIGRLLVIEFDRKSFIHRNIWIWITCNGFIKSFFITGISITSVFISLSNNEITTCFDDYFATFRSFLTSPSIFATFIWPFGISIVLETILITNVPSIFAIGFECKYHIFHMKA